MHFYFQILGNGHWQESEVFLGQEDATESREEDHQGVFGKIERWNQIEERGKNRLMLIINILMQLICHKHFFWLDDQNLRHTNQGYPVANSRVPNYKNMDRIHYVYIQIQFHSSKVADTSQAKLNSWHTNHDICRLGTEWVE